MALDKDKLKNALIAFCDRSDASFGGFPTTIDQTKDKWSDAFSSYIADLVITSPATVAPTSTTADFSGARGAFRGALAMANKSDRDAEGTELATAWAAGVNAITLTAPTPPSIVYDAAGDLIKSIVAFAADKGTLEPALKALFESPSASTAQRCDQIATAIDTATKTACQTKCTTVTPPPYPPPIVTTANQALGYG